MFQLVFRKVADVARERELAEREKNEPPVEYGEDHPVRKLISRFRKMSYTRGVSATLNMTSPDLGNLPEEVLDRVVVSAGDLTELFSGLGMY